MEKKQICNLIIDKDLVPLFVPKTNAELSEIKRQLVYDGLQSTIVTWKKVIVNGIDTYRICHEIGIPFRYESHEYFSKNEVITTISLQELRNPNITPVHRKYCIGKLGLAQHALIKEGYPFTYAEPTEEEKNSKHRFVLYRWRSKYLLESNGETKVSMDTIYSYTTYAAAIDIIYAKVPKVALDLLNMKISISLPNVIRLSELSPMLIEIIWKNLNNKIHDSNLLREIRTQIDINNTSPKKRGPKKHEVEIKRMPQYDPDAEFSSLALTVPMWNHSLARLLSIGKFTEASDEILIKLNLELGHLRDNIENLQNTIEEELDD